MQTKRIAQVSALTRHPDADKQLLKTERYTTYSDNEGVLIYERGIEYVRHDAAGARGEEILFTIFYNHAKIKTAFW